MKLQQEAQAAEAAEAAALTPSKKAALTPSKGGYPVEQLL